MKKSLLAIMFLAGGVFLVSAQTTEKTKKAKAAKTEAAAKANTAVEFKTDTVLDAAVLNTDAAVLNTEPNVLNTKTNTTVRDSAIKTQTNAELKQADTTKKDEIEKFQAQ